MKKQEILIAIVAVLLLHPAMNSLAVAAAPKSTTPTPRAIDMEVLIAVVRDGATSDRTAAFSGPSEQVAARIKQLESEGKIVVIDRIRLATVERQPAVFQNGERIPVPVGRSSGGRGGAPPLTSYQQEEIGTLVSASAVVDRNSIVVELEIEKSQLEQREANTDDADSFRPFATNTLTCRTTVRVDNGTTVLAGGLEKRANEESSQLVILVSAGCLQASAETEEAATDDRADTRQVRISSLQNMAAKEAGEIVKELSRDNPRRIGVSVDTRTNSLIISAEDKQSLDTVEAILLRLDDSAPKKSTPDLKKHEEIIRKPLVTKYDKMGKEALREELKRLQKDVLLASRASHEAKQKANEASAAYRHATDDEKFDSLLRMLETEAASRKPLERYTQLRSEFERAQRAYSKLLLVDSKKIG